MREKNKPRLAALRLIDAEVLKHQVDTRENISENDFIALLNRLRKQRNEAMEQYKSVNRLDLYDQEALEKKIIEEFLPEQLTEEKINQLISQAIAASGAQGIKQMGLVMSQLKPVMMGKADMTKVSALVREQLGGKR